MIARCRYCGVEGDAHAKGLSVRGYHFDKQVCIDVLREERDRLRRRLEGVESEEGPYMLHFEESGRESDFFIGAGAREAALASFALFRTSWNCRLFAVIRDTTGASSDG